MAAPRENRRMARPGELPVRRRRVRLGRRSVAARRRRAARRRPARPARRTAPPRIHASMRRPPRSLGFSGARMEAWSASPRRRAPRQCWRWIRVRRPRPAAKQGRPARRLRAAPTLAPTAPTEGTGSAVAARSSLAMDASTSARPMRTVPAVAAACVARARTVRAAASRANAERLPIARAGRPVVTRSTPASVARAIQACSVWAKATSASETPTAPLPGIRKGCAVPAWAQICGASSGAREAAGGRSSSARLGSSPR